MKLYLYDKTSEDIKLIGNNQTDKVPQLADQESYFILAVNEEQAAQLVAALNDGKIELDTIEWHGSTLNGVQAEQLSYITTPIKRELV